MFTVFRKFYDIGAVAKAGAAIAGGPVGLAASAGLQAVMGVAQMFKGGSLDRKADEMERNLGPRPEYIIQDGINDNQALAEYRAQQGISDAAMSVYERQANRGVTTTVDAILRGGGNMSSIADVYDASGDNYEKVALLEEEARLKGFGVLMDTNRETAAEQDKAWQMNVYNPYMDKVTAIDKLRQRAQQTKDAGRNMAVGALNNYVTGSLLGRNPQGEAGVISETGMNARVSRTSPQTMGGPVGVGSVVNDDSYISKMFKR